ncbi:hypothetical protein MMC27_003634 [Xylographa pallens]|nr:hypothetical protein [Xylographa pallens]
MATLSHVRLPIPRSPTPDSTPATPQQIPTRDLRSDSITALRAASESHKYDHFKTVKRGDLGQEFLVSPAYLQYSYRTHHPFFWFPELVSNPLEWETQTWTKRDRYLQAQAYPCPPHRHRASHDPWKAQRKAKAKAKLVGVVKDELVTAIRDERWVPEEAWDQAVLNLEDDGEGPEWCWDHTRARTGCRGQAARWKGIPAITAAELQERRNDVAGALVDGAVWRWEEGRRREEDRIIARTWEMISEGDDRSDDGWADD